MPSRACWACALIFSILAAVSSAAKKPKDDADEALRTLRPQMCEATIREMHIEIHKHKLKKNGEDDIYDTVPAICLAILQNYTLSATPMPKRTWSLTKRRIKLDDEDEPDPSMVQHLLTLKKVCERFADDNQQELSEVMYKFSMDTDPESIVSDFCRKDGPAVLGPQKAQKKQQPKYSSEGGSGKTKGAGGSKGGKKAAKAKSKGGEDDGPTEMPPSYEEVRETSARSAQPHTPSLTHITRSLSADAAQVRYGWDDQQPDRDGEGESGGDARVG